MRRDHGPRHQSLPIWRDANRLLLEIERSVCKFPRYHKYTLGSDLRRLVMEVCRCVVRAAHFVAGSEAQHADHERALERLVLLVEDLKITIQLAKERMEKISRKLFRVLPVIGDDKNHEFGQRT
ncbi:hypothetical protein CCP3SC15_270003 [Gammaproteobacteria bacterium]